MLLSRLNLFYIAIIAFIFYQLVNFIYFPLDIIFGDENRFIKEATLLVKTGEFWKDNYRAWELPLTAIIYSFFYSIFETKEGLIVSIRVFQSLLLILQAFLLYKISLKIFNSELSAKLTFIITLFYPYFIFYQALLLSETIFITILIVAFYFIYKWYENNFRIDKNFLLANFFLTLSIYSKGTLSLLVPLLLPSFYFFNKFNLKITFKILIIAITLYTLFMSPWWIRNYNVLNAFVPFTTSSGANLYLGNNPKNLSGGCDWRVDVDHSIVAKICSIKNEVLWDRAYKDEAISFIKENPSRFMELMWLKLKRFYSIVPNAEAFSSGMYKWISIFSYGIIFPLFLFAIFSNLKYWKKLSPIYILFIYFTLIHIIIIASLRYRLPLEPFMIMFASFEISKLLEKFNIVKYN